MEMRPLGRTGVDVSVCCLGTMTWGEQNTEAEGHAQMDLAVERGVNFFDTAELYPIPPTAETQGRTEEIIGSWFAKSKKRDEVVLATKMVGRSAMNWFRDDRRRPRISGPQIDEAVAKSLRRLKTDRIDLFQLHWPDRRTQAFGFHAYRDYDDDFIAFEDQLEGLARRVEAGDLRFIGVSNETPWGVTQFLKLADERGWPRLASVQNAYSLVNRTFETSLAEIAMREDVGLLAYSPLAQGYLTGKYRGGALPAGSRKQLFQRLNRYEGPGASAAVDACVDLAAALNLDPAHLAIAFAASRPFTTSVIIGATTQEQLATDLAAFDVAWAPDYDEAVEALHTVHRSPCP